MSGREPVVGPDVPGAESPSADVLDELLRAFSADPDDVDRLAEIDLTSPEVAELLTPPEAPVPADPAPAAGDDEPATDDIEVLDPTDADDGELRPDSGGVAGDPFLGPPPQDSDETDDAPGPRTISIVDAGLPDTVYIGGNLEATDVSRATVVIEDRDDGPTLSVEDASSATKIEPRLRDRRIAVKRAAGRKRLKWAAAVSAVVVVVVAALAVLGSGLFAVEDVRVEGAGQTTEDELAPIVEDLRGRPVLRTDTDDLEKDLRELPWVADARVTTQFPDGATIELRERIPAASFQGADGAWWLVDDAGRVLALSGEGPTAGYLPITGDGFPVVEVGQFVAGLEGAGTLARSLTPTMQARAASIAIRPDGQDLRLTFIDGTEVRFGDSVDLVEKLVRLEAALRDLGDGRVNYLDVSTNEVGQG